MVDQLITSPVDILRECFYLSDVSWDEERVKGLISKMLYKFTDCGANITFKEDGVVVGSIVEGSDAETQYYTLTYPFTKETWHATLDKIEEEADEIFSEVYQDDEDL